MTFSNDTRGALPELKKTLAGLLRDPLTASQSFLSQRQASGQKSLIDLQKMITESYPGEATTSATYTVTVIFNRAFTSNFTSALNQRLAHII